MSNAAEKRHMGRVAGLECQLCARLGAHQSTSTTVHHIRSGQGGSQRADDFLTVALCRDCHQGKLGVHGDRTFLRMANVTELQLLADTYRALEGAK